MTFSVTNLSHAYRSKKVLDRVSFTIGTGRFCALLGPNGAGKSTLFALLTRLFVPLSGSISIAGIKLEDKPRLALSKMGVVFQQPTLDLDLTVRQNLSYFASLHGISGVKANSAIEQALGQLDMLERASEKVRALNGGHRRRMEIARALIHQPKVLLLDEPTVGLDARTRSTITAHVHQLAKDQGMTVLWATHLVDEVEHDDDLIILHEGKVVADGLCNQVAGNSSLAREFARLTNMEAA